MPVPEWKPLNRDPDDDGCSWKAVYRQNRVPPTFEDKRPTDSAQNLDEKLYKYGIVERKICVRPAGVNGNY